MESLSTDTPYTEGNGELTIDSSCPPYLKDRQKKTRQKNYFKKERWRKKSKKKKKRKKGKKKKDREKNQNQTLDLPYITQQDILETFNQIMFSEDDIIREGQNIPDSLIFDPNRESAVFFGKSDYGEYVGKKDCVDGHVAVVGGSGSGKTTNNGIPTMFTWKGTIFSFDFKGDLIKFAERRKPKILYFLNGKQNRYFYDPFYFFKLSEEDKLIQGARELSNAIIPLPRDTPDPFWIESARNVLTGALLYYYRLGTSFIQAMIQLKTTPLKEVLKNISTDEFANAFINHDLELNPKTLSGVSMELHNHIVVFATDPIVQDALSTSDENPKEPITWENLEAQDVFIRIDQSRLDQWGSVIRLLLIQLIRVLERRPEKYDPCGKNIKPTLLLLDEFPQYGKMDSLTSALKILRSKNVTFALFFQSLADLDETYGKDTRRSILDNCPYKVILSAADAETQRYCSELVGTVKTPSMGISLKYDETGNPNGYSLNITESREPIIFPHEFASLSDVILLCPESERFCRLQKETRYTKQPPIKKGE